MPTRVNAMLANTGPGLPYVVNDTNKPQASKNKAGVVGNTLYGRANSGSLNRKAISTNTQDA